MAADTRLDLHDKASGNAGVYVIAATAGGVALANVFLEGRTPETMDIGRSQIRRRGIHYQQLLTKSALPGYAADLSEERVVTSHGASIGQMPVPRNLRW